jgi:hypothetical protein
VSGYWPGPWSGEDGGPERRQALRPGRHLAFGDGGPPEVVSRSAAAATMVVTRDPGELFLLRHTGGDDAISFVERIDPRTLAPEYRSPDLAGGPAWPGSLAAHANGSLYVVFGNHAHRLDPDLALVASAALPRDLPYNGFVILPDGHLVTKDFAGSRPGHPVPADERRPCELVVLEPERLQVVDRCQLSEPSIARLSAHGDDVYVVGDTRLLRVGWDGSRLLPEDGFRTAYRTLDGQTYGWDCVIALDAAWFLDDGEGSDRYDGSLCGHGVSTSPLHLVRIDLRSGALSRTEVCGQPGGLVANPPLIDPGRSIAVAYDSGNGVVTAFDIGRDGTLTRRWQRSQHHGGHLLLDPTDGRLVTGDFDAAGGGDQLVLLDIEDGREVVRVGTGSPVQSVLFPAAGFDGEVYLCTFTTVSRLAAPGG